MESSRSLWLALFVLSASFVGTLFLIVNDAASAGAANPQSRALARSLPPSTPAVTEWHVCQTGGADFTTIQAAVDAAQPGDVIKVAAATCTESKMVNGTPYNLYITKT